MILTPFQKEQGKIKEMPKVICRNRRRFEKIMQQYLHCTAQMDAIMLETRAELGALIVYVRENNLVTDEKLAEITSKSREESRKRQKQLEERVNELYRGFENISINRTKADPTERKGMRKGD